MESRGAKCAWLDELGWSWKEGPLGRNAGSFQFLEFVKKSRARLAVWVVVGYVVFQDIMDFAIEVGKASKGPCTGVRRDKNMYIRNMIGNTC